ncbi:MAG: fructosamine kinase family protein [Ignavibacteriaceae bacterium]|nr:fructosamine kinase family protein [Ignavibacteriaceae bacterium]
MISEEKIKARIEEKLDSKIKSLSSLSGGCISDAFKVITENGLNYFLKYNPSASNDMFIKEANGLKELAKANAIRIPEVLSFDEDYILLEYISSGSQKRKISSRSSGEVLLKCTNSLPKALDFMRIITSAPIHKKIFPMKKKNQVG